MIAMLELPGVRNGELSVTLATEPHTHARQITVAGRTHPPFKFAEPVPEERERVKRERKFGDFLRRFHHQEKYTRFSLVFLCLKKVKTS
jgi:HSP20 family molecular chaperone IbpA